MSEPTVGDGRQIGIIHIHSDYSRDGRDSLEELRAFALERNIAFVALTDHAEDFVPELYAEYRAHCASVSDGRVSLVPGLEFRFQGHSGLHLLALDLRQWIEPSTPERFIELATRAAGLTVVAHPVLARYRVPDAVLAGIDAIEIWNASYNTRYLPDPRAIELLHLVRAARPGVVGTAGLDQHDRRNDREVRVVVAGDTARPIAALKHGCFTNHGRTMSLDSAAQMGSVRLRALSLTRWAFDRVERAQDRLARAIARGSVRQ